LKSAAVCSIRAGVAAFSIHPANPMHSRDTAMHVHMMEERLCSVGVRALVSEGREWTVGGGRRQEGGERRCYQQRGINKK